MIRADLGQTIMDDQADRAPWTIKGITPETRQIAKDAANRAGLSVGEWLGGAVRRQADQDRGNAILPPGKPGQTNGQTGQALALAGDDDRRSSTTIDLASLPGVLQAAVATAQAADQLPPLRGLSRELIGLLRDQIRTARGKADLSKANLNKVDLSNRHNVDGVE